MDFVYLAVNDAFERLTGLKNIVGKKVSQVIPGVRGANQELFDIYARVASTGNSERAEIYLDSPGIWFSLCVYSSEREYFVAVFDNITERKQAEEALRLSEAQKTAILNGITTNIALLNDKLEIQWVNKAGAESVGRSPEEMVGTTCHSLWADPERPCENCPTLKAFQTKKSEETIMTTPDGRVWNERGEPVIDDRGNLIGVVELAQDITEYKRLN